MALGSRRSRRSVTASTISALRKTRRAARSGVAPKVRHAITNVMAVADLHERIHQRDARAAARATRPRARSSSRSARSRTNAAAARSAGIASAGATTDRRAGSRRMQTFRKLPTAAPTQRHDDERDATRASRSRLLCNGRRRRRPAADSRATGQRRWPGRVDRIEDVGHAGRIDRRRRRESTRARRQLVPRCGWMSGQRARAARGAHSARRARRARELREPVLGIAAHVVVRPPSGGSAPRANARPRGRRPAPA